MRFTEMSGLKMSKHLRFRLKKRFVLTICLLLFSLFGTVVKAQEVFNLPIPSSDGFLVEMSPSMLAKAYRYGRDNQYTAIEELLPEYFIELGDTWVLLSTQWAEAVISGWYPYMPEELPQEEADFLQSLSYKFIIRAPAGVLVEVWQNDVLIEPVTKAGSRELNLFLYDYSQLDIQTHMTIMGYTDSAARMDEASVQWDWSGLSESQKISLLYQNQTLFFDHWDEKTGTATFYLNGYPLTVNLYQAWFKSEDQGQTVIFIPGSFTTYQGSVEFFLLPFKPEYLTDGQDDEASHIEPLPDNGVNQAEEADLPNNTEEEVSDTGIQ
jgi:hypothetical protein